MWIVTLALARVVTEAGSAPPSVLAQDEVLLVQRHDFVVAGGCTGVPGDAGASDAGVPGDAGCSMLGDAVTLVVRPTFKIGSTGSRFAILMVTPSRPLVEATADPFAALAQITGPRVIVHEQEIEDPALGRVCPAPAPVGCGGVSWSPPDPPAPWDPPVVVDGGLGDGAVVVETVGPYEVLRVEPRDRAELETWLAALGFAYNTADLDAIEPYLVRGYTVVAVRIAVDHAFDGASAPLSLTWEGDKLQLPAGLGGTPGPIRVYIAADGRYELPGATVSFARRTSDQTMGFLTRSQVMLAPSASPDDDPIAVRSFADAEYQDEVYEERYVHVPVKSCPHAESDDWDESGCCNTRRGSRLDYLAVGLAVAFVLRRRRRVDPIGPAGSRDTAG